MNIHFSIRDRFSKCFNCFLESVSPLLITSFTFFAVIDLFFLGSMENRVGLSINQADR